MALPAFAAQVRLGRRLGCRNAEPLDAVVAHLELLDLPVTVMGNSSVMSR